MSAHVGGGGGGGLEWSDTLNYLNALDTLLTTTPDTDALAAWRSAKSELQATFGSSASHAKHLLLELQASFARAESSTSESTLPLAELQLRLEQVEGRKSAILERVQRMTAARDASAAAMQRLLQDTLSLREEQRKLESMKQGASPQLQCVAFPSPPPFFSKRDAALAPYLALARQRQRLSSPLHFCALHTKMLSPPLHPACALPLFLGAGTSSPSTLTSLALSGTMAWRAQ